MTPMQQMFLGLGVVEKTYMDDVFSTYVYTGTGASKTINNGINLSGEGGMVWAKNRGSTDDHSIVDTIRGDDKYLGTNLTSVENTETGNGSTVGRVDSFNNNGFTLQPTVHDSLWNKDGNTYSSWSFRKAPGFFDIVTYTGNDTNRAIPHGLKSMPGMIWIKRLTGGAGDWMVWHQDSHATDNEDYYLKVNENFASQNNIPNVWNNTKPTATHFSIDGADDGLNADGESYIAYLWAGGESTAATAVSVDFDGTGDYLSIPDHSDLDFGTGDFTVECWFKKQGSYTEYESVIGKYQASGDKGFWIAVHSTGKCTAGDNGNTFVTSNTTIEKDQWYHVALVRNGTTVSLYLNGTLEGTHATAPKDIDNSADLWIGNLQAVSTRDFEGHISNVRLVKGTAVYTSPFRPPTEPLTNITNTKLLCCNNSSVTGSTVTPGTITTNGNSAASSDSPFDDPEAFTFGDAGDQNVIKCGSYVGNGSSTGPEINLGWEPQWVLIKNASQSGENWTLWDNMRGVVTGGDDALLQPNVNNAEVDVDRLEFTSTGFKIKHTSTVINGNNHTLIFTAIRRSDGYVGKPAAAGTNVFAIDTGNSNTAIPNFDSGFPVDFAWAKLTGSSGNWWTSARLLQGKELKTNLTDAEASGTNKVFDSSVGWHDTNGTSTYISHMWKRHAGFDVVTYDGTSTAGHPIRHNLSKIPEMIWVKAKTGTSAQNQNWRVYHKGLNGGTNPEQYFLNLDNTVAENDNTGNWNDTAPTSTHVTLGNSAETNSTGYTYLMMLFASVDGISSVGKYSGSASDVTVTTGFTPRFVLVKKVNGGAHWHLFDSLRDLDASGNEGKLLLNEDYAQGTTTDMINTTATGFVMESGVDGDTNSADNEYIYYAHA